MAGSRLTLRPLSRADAYRLVALLADEAARAALGLARAPTLAEEEAFLDALAAAADPVVLGVVARADGRLVGVGALRRAGAAPGTAELGIVLGDPADRGKGLGTEATGLLLAHAFEALGLARVELRADAGDARALGAYVRAGFRRVRLLPAALRREGRDVDLVEMAVDRDEWAAARAGEMR